MALLRNTPLAQFLFNLRGVAMLCCMRNCTSGVFCHSFSFSRLSFCDRPDTIVFRVFRSILTVFVGFVLTP